MIVVVDEGVEDLRTGGLGAFLAVAVADLLEQAVLVLQLEVVPVLATDEDAGIAVLEFEVMDALEDLREGLALLEVQSAIVAGRGEGFAAVGGADQLGVGIADRPTGADRQGRVELAFDLPDIEGDGLSRRGNADSDGQSQDIGLEDSGPCCCCHAALRERGWWNYPGPYAASRHC
ncbi:hypothetical protein D9M68_640700 [compost metagenome]